MLVRITRVEDGRQQEIDSVQADLASVLHIMVELNDPKQPLNKLYEARWHKTVLQSRPKKGVLLYNEFIDAIEPEMTLVIQLAWLIYLISDVYEADEFACKTVEKIPAWAKTQKTSGNGPLANDMALAVLAGASTWQQAIRMTKNHAVKELIQLICKLR